MNGSTHACISLLNAFSLVLLLLGLAGIGLVVSTAANSTTESMVRDVSALVGAIVLSALLRGASEALRLLSEINESLRRSRAVDSSRSARAA